MNKRTNKLLFWVFVFIIIISIALTYYRTIMINDFEITQSEEEGEELVEVEE